MIRVYNSLTNKKEDFVPITDGQIKMYVCGVTVYDVCHIGHARSAFVFDVIRRYFKYRGFDILFVRNVTDVDDKIINKALGLKSDNLNIATKEVAEKYYKAYCKDMNDLGIESPDIEPKATGHINDMIDMIKGLIDKGYAYQNGANVYFRVRKYKEYGCLSNQSIEQILSGVRIDVREGKEDALDFALWKEAKEGEPSWISPWGHGRPGWHIECSVMSTKYLGKSFDIHAGGRDLIFPHHENEIAQARCAIGGDFAKYWIHNGLLTINGEKMAKSLGNFATIENVLAQYGVDALKIFFLQSHYASNIDYTSEKMKEAIVIKNKFINLFDSADRLSVDNKCSSRVDFNTADVLAGVEKFKSAMDDDFNTPVALTVLFDLVNRTNKALGSECFVSESDLLTIKFSVKTIKYLSSILGLFLSIGSETQNSSSNLGEAETFKNIILALRQTARDKKLYELSDSIRDELKKSGYVVKDLKGKSVIDKA